METIFHSENISFVKVNEDLVNDYLKMVNDFEGVAQYIGKRRTPYTVEEELNFVKAKLETKAPIFSMIESKSGEFIGNIEFMDIKDGFAELGLKRVVLKVYPNNARAIHVYEKCGFVTYETTDEDIYMEIFSD